LAPAWVWASEWASVSELESASVSAVEVLASASASEWVWASELALVQGSVRVLVPELVLS
jgi:hypothetical protein